MPTITVLLLCAGALALVWYIREKIRARSLKAAFIKSLVSALFIAVGLCGAFRSASAARAVMSPFALFGLVCGLMGDIWLDLKYVFPEKDEALTYAGFFTFGFGHAAYIAGLLLAYFPAGKPLYGIVPFALAVLMSLGNAVLEKPMGLRYGKMKPTVIAYGALLFSTLALSGSLALCYGWGEKPLNLMFAGAVLFALSDLVLSGTYFGEGKDRPVDLILNYCTYYPGQFLIALSLLFLA